MVGLKATIGNRVELRIGLGIGEDGVAMVEQRSEEEIASVDALAKQSLSRGVVPMHVLEVAHDAQEVARIGVIG